MVQSGANEPARPTPKPRARASTSSLPGSSKPRLASPDQIATLRTLVERLEEFGREQDESQAELERLRAEVTRLTQENAKLAAQLGRVRAILD